MSSLSTESSASETTPLRRPESELSDDVAAARASTNNSPDNSLLANRLPANRSTVAIANRSNNNNNNNTIETRLGQGGAGDTVSQMETNKRILCRVGLDVLILLCVGFPILGYYLWGKAYQRGFFCDDESLMHPYKDSTVRNWMLYIIGLVIPVFVMLTVEVINSKRAALTSNGNSTARRYVLMGYQVPDWLLECYKKMGVFVFGAGLSQLTTDIAKYSIGRLRPHFLAVCQPIMADGTSCENPINAGKYITDFTCRGFGSSQRMLKEIRLSFPSGHSSFTFFTMVYIALYLQARMNWRGSRLLRHFLQFLLIMVAWYTALSRVSDYKHHWSDVLAGSLIGALCAVVVSYFMPGNTFNCDTIWPIELCKEN